MIFYVAGQNEFVDSSNSTFRGLAVAVSENSNDFINGLWGYDADGAVCLEDQYFNYSEALNDISGLQNTLNLSSHRHVRTFNGSLGLTILPFLAF